MVNGQEIKMVKVTPLATDDIEYRFTIHSEQDDMAKGYAYDTKTECVRARAKAIKLFKDSGYLVLQ
ncbi:MAG: hypothetical protein V3R25_10205 [Nitrosomonadaceae bacterium]